MKTILKTCDFCGETYDITKEYNNTMFGADEHEQIGIIELRKSANYISSDNKNWNEESKITFDACDNCLNNVLVTLKGCIKNDT